MNEFAERIERDFPVRRKEKEKVDFRTWLVYTLKELGYSPKLESGTSALSAGGNVTNVVVGDIEKAKIVLAAHYDTACARSCRRSFARRDRRRTCSTRR